MPYKQLLSAVTTTGASTTYQWLGGIGTLSGTGFGSSGAFKLQHSPDGTNWISSSTEAVLNASSSAGAVNFQLPVCQIRVLVTVASTTGISAWVN